MSRKEKIDTYQLPASLHISQRPTKRAPDAGDSVAISSSFHALAFFCSDGFAVRVPAQVTHAVGRLTQNRSNKQNDI